MFIYLIFKTIFIRFPNAQCVYKWVSTFNVVHAYIYIYHAIFAVYMNLYDAPIGDYHQYQDQAILYE